MLEEGASGGLAGASSSLPSSPFRAQEGSELPGRRRRFPGLRHSPGQKEEGPCSSLTPSEWRWKQTGEAADPSLPKGLARPQQRHKDL